MTNKIQKENNSLDLPNYQPLRNELSKILENQRISKKKQDQILETTQRGFIGIALRNEELFSFFQVLNFLNQPFINDCFSPLILSLFLGSPDPFFLSFFPSVIFKLCNT